MVGKTRFHGGDAVVHDEPHWDSTEPEGPGVRLVPPGLRMPWRGADCKTGEEKRDGVRRPRDGNDDNGSGFNRAARLGVMRLGDLGNLQEARTRIREPSTETTETACPSRPVHPR